MICKHPINYHSYEMRGGVKLFFCLTMAVLLFSGCGLFRAGLDRDKASERASVISVLVDKGFRAERLEGGEVLIVVDQEGDSPRMFYFAYSLQGRWKLEGMRERLLTMGALRVALD